MNHARILIVEDQPPMAKLIQICVRKLGHEVVATTSRGEEAVQLAAQLRPDLVLMDIELAGVCDGVEAACTIRKQTGIQCLFVTSQCDYAIVERARGAEPVGYLVKPFLEFELQATLDTALNLRATQSRLLQFSRAVEQSPASIVITDPQGRIEYVNARFTEVSGYTAAEAIGRNPRVLKSGVQPAAYYRDLWATLLAGREWRGEFCNRRKNGEHYWELASISAIRDESGRATHYVAVKEDVTARHEVEAQLLQSHLRLREANQQLTEAVGRERELAAAADAANRAKSAFLANMSHELRTPLNAINGAAATLIEATAKTEAGKAARLILECGEDLHGTIEEILAYTGLQAEAPRIDPRPFALLEVVAKSLRLAGELARRKGIRLSWWIAPATPARVVADPRRLQQILRQLLQNAVKFTNHGRIHLSVTARRRDDDTWQLSFSVTDTGIGIAPGFLPKLFTPFAREMNAQTLSVGGTGLGLANARAQARLLGGTLVVRSRPGLGSTFRCSFPASVIASPPWLAGTGPQAGAGLRLLLVSPDPRRRRWFTALADAWGLQVTLLDVAATPDQLAGAGPFNLAVIDAAALPEAEHARAVQLRREFDARRRPILWIGREIASTAASSTNPITVLDDPIDLGDLVRSLLRILGETEEPAGSAAGQANAPRAPLLGERLPLRILAADDIRTNREVLGRTLGFLGHRVELVENGAEVLMALERAPFDLVLLDVRMPVMDGLTAARTIVQRYPDAARRPKLVAVTAQALPGDRAIATEAGMDDYLTKPVLPQHLQTCLLRLFEPEVPPLKIAITPPVLPPLIDQAHLGAAFPGLEGRDQIEVLRAMQEAVASDFAQIWPRVVSACATRDQAQLADLAHGLKGCFRTVGWARVAEFCTMALDQARENRFTAWTDFAGQLRQLFVETDAAMTGLRTERAPHEIDEFHSTPSTATSRLLENAPRS